MRESGQPAANKHHQQSEATRLALLDSARRIFARDGFEACRIEDVAAATGHTRGAFYTHFRSKEDLFFALLEKEAARRTQQMRAALDRCGTAEECIAALREFFVSRIGDHRWAMLMIEFKLFAVRHPDLRPRLAAAHRRIRSAFRIEISELQPESCGDLQKAALEAILAGFSLEFAYDPSLIPKRQAKEILGALFDVLIRA